MRWTGWSAICVSTRRKQASGSTPFGLAVPISIAYLVRMGRACPDLEAKLFFYPDDIQAAYLLNNNRPHRLPH